MKKIYQKLFSIFFVLLFSASCVPASAVDVNSVAQNHIKQFCYIVYDKEGNVKETGITPDGDARYSWSGIQLDNGESVKLLNQNNFAFTIPANVRYDFVVSLDRKANMRNLLIRSNYLATDPIKYVRDWMSITEGYSQAATLDESGYYYFQIANYSSDSVTIESVELLF